MRVPGGGYICIYVVWEGKSYYCSFASNAIIVFIFQTVRKHQWHYIVITCTPCSDNDTRYPIIEASSFVPR